MERLSRRQAITALTFSLATGALTLTGCGGGSSHVTTPGGGTSTPGGTPTPGSPATPTPGAGGGTPGVISREAFAGTVDLPPGLAATGLQVVNVLTSVPLGAGNTFQVDFPSGNGPCAAHVIDAQKQVALTGFLRFGASVISARTTAEVLTYYGLGGWMLAPDARVALVDLLASADLRNVEDAVKAAIISGGSAWMTIGIAPVQEAVVSAAKRLRPVVPDAGKARHSSPNQTRATLVRNTGHASTPTRGILLAPTEAQSGIQIDANDLDGFTAINNYRRRARLFVERVSTRKGGVDTPSSQALQVVELSPVAAATSLLYDFASALGGASFYEPTRSNFISAPNLEGVDSTTYRLTGVGAGVSRGQYDRLSADQKDSARGLFFKTLILDFLVPLIVNLVIPLKDESISSALDAEAGGGVLRDLISTFGSTLPDLWDKIISGESSGFAGGVAVALDAIRQSNTFQSALIDALNLFLTRRGTGPGDFAYTVNAAIGKVLNAPNLVLGAVDIALQALSIGQSTLADTWEFTVTKPTIRVSPKEVSLDPHETVQQFVVNVGDDGDQSGNVFEYQWTSTAQYGTLRATRGDGVDSFTVGQDEVGNTQNTVVYTTNNKGGSGETDTLTVTVYRKSVSDASPVKQKLGTATVQVHIKKEFVLQVAPTQAEMNTDSTLGLSAYFDPPLPPGTKVRYNWRATGKGTLSGATSDANVGEATVTYHSPSTEGMETVNVIANITRPGTNFTFATNSATATIDVKKGLKTITVNGYWTIEEEFYNDGPTNPRVSSVAYLVIPKVQNALSYAVTADGYNDTFSFLGTSLSRGINPASLGDVQDRGGTYWSGLSGASSPVSGASGNRDWFQTRFGGMRVKVVVTLKD